MRPLFLSWRSRTVSQTKTSVQACLISFYAMVRREEARARWDPVLSKRAVMQSASACVSVSLTSESLGLPQAAETASD